MIIAMIMSTSNDSFDGFSRDYWPQAAVSVESKEIERANIQQIKELH